MAPGFREERPWASWGWERQTLRAVLRHCPECLIVVRRGILFQPGFKADSTEKRPPAVFEGSYSLSPYHKEGCVSGHSCAIKWIWSVFKCWMMYSKLPCSQKVDINYKIKLSVIIHIHFSVSRSEWERRYRLWKFQEQRALRTVRSRKHQVSLCV